LEEVLGSRHTLSVIIVSWNSRDRLTECLTSLGEQVAELSIETWVVDNHSNDGSVDLVREQFPWVNLLVNRENQGFARANNRALSLATGRYVLFLNPDTQLLSDALAVLLRFMDDHPKVGAVGPQVLFPEGSIQPSCRRFPTLATVLWEAVGLDRALPDHPRFGRYLMGDWDHRSLCRVDQPIGACLMVRSSALEQVGQFDDQFFLFFEEVDLCRRLRSAGWEIYFVPEAQVIHHGGHSTGQDFRRAVWLFHSSRYKYFRKHFGPGGEWLLRMLMVASFPWQLLLRVLLVMTRPMDRERMVKHFITVAVQLAAAVNPV
jgi:GT2 family glycosyltransferase